jgi:hypothetical protein
MRAALREDPAVAALGELRDDARRVEGLLRCQCDHARARGETVCEPAGAGLGREDERARLECRVSRVEPAARAEDDEFGVRATSEPAAELGEAVRRVGKARAGVQRELGEAERVPEPITTASQQARRRPIRNLSALLAAATTRFERGSDGIATTPSSVATKFAISRVSGNPSPPP